MTASSLQIWSRLSALNVRKLLWESNVIVRSMLARYGNNTLYSQDLVRRFQAERWMDWQQTTLNSAGRAAFLQLIRTPGSRRDPAVILASVTAMTPLLEQLDTHLERWYASLSSHPATRGVLELPLTE